MTTIANPETAGLSQEYRADRPYAPDWHVERVKLAHPELGLRAAYPFWVIGRLESGEPFFWNVPSIHDWRYDLTATKYDDNVLQAFGLDLPTIVDLFDGE